MRVRFHSFLALLGFVWLVAGAATPSSTSSHTTTSHPTATAQVTAAPKNLAFDDTQDGGFGGIFGLGPQDSDDQPDQGSSSSDGIKTESNPFAIFGPQSSSASSSTTVNTSTTERKDSTSTSATSHSTSTPPPTSSSPSSTSSPTNSASPSSSSSNSSPGTTWKLVGIATLAFASVGLVLLAALTVDTWTSFLRDTLHLGRARRSADDPELMPDWEKASWTCAVPDPADAPGRARLPSFLNLEGATPRWRAAGRGGAWGVAEPGLAPGEYATEHKRVSGLPPAPAPATALRSPSVRHAASPQPQLQLAPGPLIFRHPSARSTHTALSLGAGTPQLRPVSNPFSPPQEYTVQMAQVAHLATATALSPRIASPRVAATPKHEDAYDGIDVTEQGPHAA